MEIELMGIYEIARLAGVSPQAVSNWVIRKPDFPKPLSQLASGPVWEGNTIRAWLSESGVVSTATTEQRKMKTFTQGMEYTLADIRAILGGEIQSYLPQRGSVILCGRFTRKMNPEAPHEILVGNPPNVQRKAQLMADQGGVIPVFLKEGRNRWRYHGPMQVIEYNTDPKVFGPKARVAGRDDVVGVLLFRDRA